MKFKAFILILVVKIELVCAQNLTEYRNIFVKSATEASYAEMLYSLTKNIDAGSDPIFIGYKAMSNFMMCNYTISPFSKLSYFKEGRFWLEKAIYNQPDNTELIFMRFSVQTKLPTLLGYNGSLLDDKTTLFNYLRNNSGKKKKDIFLYNIIKSFLISNNICNKEELIMLTKLT